jgi:hypothetical protein
MQPQEDQLPVATPLATYANIPNVHTFNSVYTTPQPHIMTDFSGTPEMVMTWRLSRTVKFFAAIDVFICILYFITYPPLMFLTVLPIVGYYGAKQYNTLKCYGYLSFVLANIALRCYAYTLEKSALGLFFTIISVIVECWIFRIIWRFIQMIKTLRTDELDQLKVPGWQPLQTSLVWS